MVFENRIIWMYWHQGFENAPFVVQRCVNQWKKLNPNWKLVQLNQENIHNYINPIPIKEKVLQEIKIQHRSDLIRTQLLINHGGVWADPTTFCLVKLDDWLFNYMQTGLFMFRNPGRDRLISNWFMASTRQHPILIKLFDELCAYWQNNQFVNLGRADKSKLELILNGLINRNLYWPRFWFHPIMTKLLKLYPYMVYHYMYYKVIQENTELSRMDSIMPVFKADIPHRLKRIGLMSEVKGEVKQLIDEKRAPLFKLDWKIAEVTITKNSVLNYLFSTNNA